MYHNHTHTHTHTVTDALWSGGVMLLHLFLCKCRNAEKGFQMPQTPDVYSEDRRSTSEFLVFYVTKSIYT